MNLLIGDSHILCLEDYNKDNNELHHLIIFYYIYYKNF